MQIQIVDTPWVKTLVGVSKRHDPSLSYGDEIRVLLGPVWEAVRRDKIATTGINHVYYGEQDEIFCGLEFSGAPVPLPGLTQRRIELGPYAYYRHIGPYELIPEAAHAVHAEVERLGLWSILPMMEIYGHWNEDPQKLETEILISVSRS
jgi:hypothetical protein